LRGSNDDVPKIDGRGCDRQLAGQCSCSCQRHREGGIRAIGADHETSGCASPRLRCKRNIESHTLACVQRDRQVQAAGRERGARGACRRNHDAGSTRVGESFRQCLGVADLNATEAEIGWAGRELAGRGACSRERNIQSRIRCIGCDGQVAAGTASRRGRECGTESHTLACVQRDRQAQAAGRERGARGACRRNHDAGSARVGESFRQCLGVADLNATEAEIGWAGRELAGRGACSRERNIQSRIGCIGCDGQIAAGTASRRGRECGTEIHTLTCVQRDRQVQAAGRERGARGACRRNHDAGSARVGKSFRQGLGVADLNATEAEAGRVGRELAGGYTCTRHWQGRSNGPDGRETVVVFAMSDESNRDAATVSARRLWSKCYVAGYTLPTSQGHGITQTAKGEACS